MYPHSSGYADTYDELSPTTRPQRLDRSRDSTFHVTPRHFTGFLRFRPCHSCLLWYYSSTVRTKKDLIAKVKVTRGCVLSLCRTVQLDYFLHLFLLSIQKRLKGVSLLELLVRSLSAAQPAVRAKCFSWMG